MVCFAAGNGNEPVDNEPNQLRLVLDNDDGGFCWRNSLRTWRQKIGQPHQRHQLISHLHEARFAFGQCVELDGIDVEALGSVPLRLRDPRGRQQARAAEVLAKVQRFAPAQDRKSVV